MNFCNQLFHKLQWFRRKKGSRNCFLAQETNGQPYTSIQPAGTIILYGFTMNRTEQSFFVSDHWLDVLTKGLVHLLRENSKLPFVRTESRNFIEGALLTSFLVTDFSITGLVT